MAFRVGNIRVSLDFWFFALVSAVVLLDKDRLLAYFILPVLIHECGHAAVLLTCRIPVREIRFSAFGITIRRAPGLLLSDPAELCLSLGGIAANLLAAGFLYFFCFQSVRVMLLVAANVAVALFSALPVGDLDGGQAATLLASRFFSPGTARALSAAASLLVLTALIAFAVFQLLSQAHNPTLLITCAYLIYNVAHSINS